MPWSHVQWHRHFCKSMSDATRLRRYADCVLTVRANIRSLPNDIRLCSIVLSLLKTPLVQLVFILCITSETLKVVTKHVTTPRCNHTISTNIFPLALYSWGSSIFCLLSVAVCYKCLFPYVIPKFEQFSSRYSCHSHR